MAEAKIGRPTAFTPDTKDLILEYIEAGYSNTKACQMVGVDVSNLYLTQSRDPEFREKYDAAKAAAVDAMVDEAEEAAQDARRAENGHQVAGAKVFADFKKWQAARLAPNRWGDKAQINITTQLDSSDQEMAKRIAFLEALNGNGPGDDAEPDDDGGDLV
jgi:hypothetical protein